MGKSSGNNETVQKTEPWAGLQPYLKDAYQNAQNLFRSGGPDFFPNATYVPFSDQSNMGIDLLTNRALQGSQWQPQMGNLATNLMTQQNPALQQAQNTLSDTAQGKYLNQNPWLDTMFGTAASKVTDTFNNAVMPSLNATFGQAGRTGSGAHAMAAGDASGQLSDSLYRMANDVYGGNYQAERDRMVNSASGLTSVSGQNLTNQMAGANLGMGLGELQYSDIGNLMGAGSMIEGKAGEMLGDQMNRFNFYQNRPEQQMNNYVAWLSGIPGSQFGTQHTDTDMNRNSTAGNFAGDMFSAWLKGGF